MSNAVEFWVHYSVYFVDKKSVYRQSLSDLFFDMAGVTGSTLVPPTKYLIP